MPNRLSRQDWYAMGVLVTLPALAYAVPAAFGHPILLGDDTLQNFPLRVLVGHQIRSGHLPLLDLGIWSGTPLLAGWNAGAAYPFTWIFAALGGTAAWTLNLMLVSWTAGIGMYAFLRASRRSSAAAAFGALTFAYLGTMLAQIVHFGVVAGASWIPLICLAMLRMSEIVREGSLLDRRITGWSALLCVSAAMVLLAGDPRAVDVAVVVTGAYALWLCARSGSSAGRLVAWLVLSGLIAVAIGAVQLVPGLHAISVSQRGKPSFSLYSSGSYPVRWLLLLVTPNLLGGPGSFGLPGFFASYNLTEVTAYVGLLPWVAALALLARLRRGRGIPEWVVWEVVVLVGLILAIGGNLPTGHLLYHLPLFGAQRLQSRNMAVVDYALAVLVAYWWDERSPVTSHSDRHGNTERLLGAIPGLSCAGAALCFLVDGRPFLLWLGVAASGVGTGLREWPGIVPFLALGLGAVTIAVVTPRLAPTTRHRVIAAFALTDAIAFLLLGFFAVGAPPGASAGAPIAAISDPAPATAGATTVVPIYRLHIPGRFIIYDPQLYDAGELNTLGAPDLNVTGGAASIQGYGSIVNGRYASATGVHVATGVGQNTLSVVALRHGVLDQLDPGAFLAPPQELVTPIAEPPARGSAHGSSDGAAGLGEQAAGPGDGAAGLGEQAAGPGDGAAGVGDRAAGPGDRSVNPGSTTTWFFGEELPVRSASVRVSVPDRPGRIQAGLLLPRGRTDWLQPVTAAPGREVVLRFSWARSPEATALLVRMTSRRAAPVASSRPSRLSSRAPVASSGAPGLGGSGPVVAGGPTPLGTQAPVVYTRSGQTLRCDGPLQSGLLPSQWRYVGEDGDFGVWRASHPDPPLRLVVSGAVSQRLEDHQRPAGSSTPRPRTVSSTTLATTSVEARASDHAGEGSIRAVSGPSLAPLAAEVSTRTPAAVIRSVSDIPGWHATYQPLGHHAQPHPIAIHRFGLVQEVYVPPGRGIVRWSYEAPGQQLATALGAVGLLLLAGLCALAWSRTRLGRQGVSRFGPR